jgi:hypothetical protein
MLTELESNGSNRRTIYSHPRFEQHERKSRNESLLATGHSCEQYSDFTLPNPHYLRFWLTCWFVGLLGCIRYTLLATIYYNGQYFPSTIAGSAYLLTGGMLQLHPELDIEKGGREAIRCRQPRSSGGEESHFVGKGRPAEGKEEEDTQTKAHTQS